MSNPIQHSLELAAERCDDLTPLVYRRLFAQHPEAESMFRTDGGDLVKGSMLAFALDAILDFAGERSGHFRMIECEVLSHDAYGTPRELFNALPRNACLALVGLEEEVRGLRANVIEDSARESEEAP